MQQHPYMHKLGFLPLISSGFLLSKQNTRYCKAGIIDFINFTLYSKLHDWVEILTAVMDYCEIYNVRKIIYSNLDIKNDRKGKSNCIVTGDTSFRAL